MADVEFQEEEDLAIRRPVTQKRPSESGLMGMIIKAKLAKDEKQANQVLIIIGVACVVLAVAIFFATQNSGPRAAAPTPGVMAHPLVPTGGQSPQ